MSKNSKIKKQPAVNVLLRSGSARGESNSTSLLTQALALHQQGQLGSAERLYRQVLACDAQNVVAMNFLGMLLQQSGQSELALALLTQAVGLKPDYAPAWTNHGLALRKLGRHEESAASHQRALELNPDYTEAWVNLANALRDLKRPQEAVSACERALAIRPDLAQAFNTQGAALNDMGLHENALACYARAIALAPRFANAHFNCGVALGELKRNEEALHSYALALEYDPNNAITWNNRGVVLDERRRHEEAIGCYVRALEIQPDYFEAQLNRGTSLEDLSQYEAALCCFDKAIAIQPANVNAHAARGQCLFRLQRFTEAAQAFSTVVKMAPHHPFARGQLYDAWSRAADWTHLATLAVEMTEDVHMGRPTVMPFSYLAVRDNANDQLRCAQTYASHQYPDTAEPLWQGEVYAHERIRVAYLSADFHDHATAHLLAEVFEAHDSAQFEISALSFGPDRGDPMRERLQRNFHPFVDVSQLSDAQVAQWLRSHEIDIAVDLKGYTQDSRPGIFAYRGAPVQVNFLGYPGTLGAGYWDYIISDSWVTPPGSEDGFREHVVRMPHSYQPNCADKPVAVHKPSRIELGLPVEGFVFCSFNHSYKITLAVFEVWMRLLKAIDGSILWLLVDTPETVHRLQQTAESLGVAGQRIVFAPRLPLPEHLARLALADLFLDTLPINAHTTASDALWSGLPVVTCSGHSFASRVAGSLLHAVGLPDLVTECMVDYEALALRLARSPELLQLLKARLASNRMTHSLFDPVRFALDLEKAYVQIVAQSRQGLRPRGFSVQ